MWYKPFASCLLFLQLFKGIADSKAQYTKEEQTEIGLSMYFYMVGECTDTMSLHLG